MSEQFQDGFALYDRDHRLVDWDDGFVQEFRLAGVKLEPGMYYADVLRAATAHPASLAMFAEQTGIGDGDRAVQERLIGFGSNRSCCRSDFWCPRQSKQEAASFDKQQVGINVTAQF